MIEFFRNLEFNKIHSWSDYFSAPMSTAVLRDLVGGTNKNIRISCAEYHNPVTLPSVRATGYIFVCSGVLRIRCEASQDTELVLKENAFCKIPKGHYWIDYSKGSQFINMWFVEEASACSQSVD